MKGLKFNEDQYFFLSCFGCCIIAIFHLMFIKTNDYAFYKGYEFNGFKLYSFKNKLRLCENFKIIMYLQFIVFECDFNAQRYKSTTKTKFVVAIQQHQ